MSINDSWFERNEGFINFAGHLVAIGQRNALIQQEAQTQALLQQGITLEQKRQRADEHERHCKDILYDINQAAGLIRDEYAVRPQQAYYQALLLSDKVGELHLSHTSFTELQWKDYCIQTKRAVSDLVNYSSECLTGQQMIDVRNKIDSEKRVLEQQVDAERELAEAKRVATELARRERDRRDNPRVFIGSLAGFALGILIIAADPATHGHPHDDFAGICIFGILLLILSGIFALGSVLAIVEDHRAAKTGASVQRETHAATGTTRDRRDRDSR